MSSPSGLYTLEGARQLRASLRAAGDDLSDLKATNKQVGDIVATRSRSIAVKDKGGLAATIRGAGTKTAAIIRAGNNSSVRYAGPIHWGWGRRGIKARTFLPDGAQFSEPTWLPLYEQALSRAIDKIEGI